MTKKTFIENYVADYNKTVVVVQSCMNENHLIGAKNMVVNLYNKHTNILWKNFDSILVGSDLYFNEVLPRYRDLKAYWQKHKTMLSVINENEQ